MQEQENRMEEIRNLIISALNLMDRWQLKLIYWIIREIISR